MAGLLKECGFTNDGNTGSWSTDSSDPSCVVEKLNKVLEISADPDAAQVKYPVGTCLDNMFIYIENIIPKKSDKAGNPA